VVGRGKEFLSSVKMEGEEPGRKKKNPSEEHQKGGRGPGGKKFSVIQTT